MLVHIVLTRFRDDADIDQAARRLRELPAAIDVIRSLSCGRDVVRSERSYDLGWIVELDSRADLQTYTKHPAHEQVAQWIADRRSDIAVVDFER